MKDPVLEQLEFERQKRALIKTAQQHKKVSRAPKKDPVAYQDDRQETIEEIFSKAYPEPQKVSDRESSEDRKFAWEYEIEKYRRDRLKHRFCIIGSICGILSLALTIWFHFSEILALF